MMVLLAVLGLLALQRGAELVLSRRNARWLTARGARLVRADGFGLIVAVHALSFVLPVLEAAWTGTRVGWWTAVGAGLFVAGQALRYHAITSLGRRWNTRVYVLPDAPLVASGPYRVLRHPNYVGVALELAGLPLAFGLWRTALALTVLDALALARRIRVEERALGPRAEAGPDAAGPA